MKLFYRGVSYEDEPSTIEVVEGEVGGTYRGHEWKTHQAKRVHKRQTPVQLTYRGVTYRAR
jgi:hypothetical protein